MYSDLILGNTVSLKAAQCGQVIDAYSVIVTEALAGPSAMSGSDTGLATSDALCAIASTIRRSGENPARAASPVSNRAVVKTRLVMNNTLLRNSALLHTHTHTHKKSVGYLKRQLWQRQAARFCRAASL